MEIDTKQVPVGLGTILGLVATVASAAIAIVQSIDDNQALLTGNNKAAGIIAFAAPIATALGRMFQAAQLPKAAALANEIGQLPAVLAVLAGQTKASAQATGSGAQTSGAPTGEGERLADAFAALATHAQQNVAKVEADPDNVDGPHVAFASEANEGELGAQGNPEPGA